MNSNEDRDGQQVSTPAHRQAKPRLSWWLWTPWYAKAWWAGSIVYWTGFAFSFPMPAFRTFYESTLAGYLNVALYPFVILMVLGTGFIRARIRSGDRIIVAGDPGLHRFNRSEGGSLDPYSDPLDHRSGSLWVGSPQSRARLFGREWP